MGREGGRGCLHVPLPLASRPRAHRIAGFLPPLSFGGASMHACSSRYLRCKTAKVYMLFFNPFPYHVPASSSGSGFCGCKTLFFFKKRSAVKLSTASARANGPDPARSSRTQGMQAKAATRSCGIKCSESKSTSISTNPSSFLLSGPAVKFLARPPFFF